MKKSEFDGFDFACVEMFKAPIDTFDTKSDFKKWANNKFNDLAALDKYEAKSCVTEERGELLPLKLIEIINKDRIPVIKDWIKYLTKGNDTYKNDPAQRLLIFSSIMKGVSKENTEAPPALEQRVLADTMENISQRLKNNKKEQFNLKKIYCNTRQKAVLGEYVNTGETATKWVVIPSKAHDKKNFEQNVERLKVLSHNGWCTKSYNAAPYLEKGDFHIYLEDGQPKVALRFNKDKLVEIEGTNNNTYVPLDYVDIVKEYVAQNKFKVSDRLRSLEFSQDYYKAQKEMDAHGFPKRGDKDYAQKVFEFIGIKVEKDEQGKLKLDKYYQPNGTIDEDGSWNREWGDVLHFEHLDIDENVLLKDVVSIDKPDFSRSKVTEMPSLKYINSDADFTELTIKKLPALESIEGDAFFWHEPYGNKNLWDSKTKDEWRAIIKGNAYYYTPNQPNTRQIFFKHNW